MALSASSGSEAHTTPVDTKSLESWIWSAACSIRGAQAAPKYKDFILPLIFVKRLCDVYDDELDRIAAQVGSRAKAFKLVKSDNKLVRFYLPLEPADPEQPVWSVIRTLSNHIGEQLTTLLREIADANPLLKGIIDRIDFNATTHGQRDLDDDRLSDLVEAISAKRLGLKDVEADVIGRSYEYLIRKFAEGSGQSAGEFYTPPEVGILMARIVDCKPGMDVYDPCCGSAGLLIKCQLVADEQDSKDGSGVDGPIRLYGQESEGGTWAMANMNMIIHDMEGAIELGDSLRDPKFRTPSGLRKFDRIVANPMWNQDWFKQADYEADTFSRFVYGIPPDSTADWGWVQSMLASVSSDGRIAVVLDTAATSRGSGVKVKSRERDIRQKIVEAGLVDAVILLPENLFYNTGAPGIILILDKGRSPSDPVRLINGSRLFVKGQPKNRLAPEHIDRILEAYRSEVDIDDLSRVVATDVLAAIDFDLSPSRHVPLDPAVPVVPLSDGLEAAEAAQNALVSAHKTTEYLLSGFSLPSKPSGKAPRTDWKSAPLSDLIAEKMSGDWGEEHLKPGSDFVRCAVIRGTDFPAVAQLRFANVPVRYINAKSLEKRQVAPGDLLVEISGGGKYQSTGRAILLTEETFSAANDPIMFTNFTKLLRVDVDKILPRYFFYHWSYVYDLGRMARYEKQPTNIRNFKLDDFLKSELISFPSDLDEQQQIVSALDAIHDEIRALEMARNNVLSVRHASLKELLTGVRLAAPVAEQ